MSEKLVFLMFPNVSAWTSNVSWHGFSFTWLPGPAKMLIFQWIYKVFAKPSFPMFGGADPVPVSVEKLVFLRFSNVLHGFPMVSVGGFFTWLPGPAKRMIFQWFSRFLRNRHFGFLFTWLKH